jgi:oxaloacetate decarboxylase alpha subunit
MSTTRRQLSELHLEHRFDDVMAEVTRVRAELGYPIMVTPFPQMVCTQALYNVIGDERYSNVADQLIRYALGRFGRPTTPIDPNVLDRILSRPRAAELMHEAEALPLKEMRKKFSPKLSDEEFILRATMPADQVDAMCKKGPSKRHYNPEAAGLVKLLKALGERPRQSRVFIQQPGLTLDIRSAAKEAN